MSIDAGRLPEEIASRQPERTPDEIAGPLPAETATRPSGSEELTGRPPETIPGPQSTDIAGRLPEEVRLREEIRQTRAELSHTVEALAARADVVGRARTRAARLRRTVKTPPVSWVLAGLLALAATAAVGVATARLRNWRRR